MSVALTTWTLSTLGIWVSGKHAAYLEQQGNLGSVSRSDRFKANRPTTRQNPKTQKKHHRAAHLFTLSEDQGPFPKNSTHAYRQRRVLSGRTR